MKDAILAFGILSVTLLIAWAVTAIAQALGAGFRLSVGLGIVAWCATHIIGGIVFGSAVREC